VAVNGSILGPLVELGSDLRADLGIHQGLRTPSRSGSTLSASKSLPTNAVTSVLCLATSHLLDVWLTSVRMGDGLLSSRKVGPKVHHKLGR
jgi:hypothetical protein